ncbi:hypothetical protein BJF77_04140 [Kocuria sp. CNJ-770]|uniref:Uncharacterized protein n=1 Tax=Kocuria oceani TaxID=988827 RepID=A0ABV9TGY0_9MICC|nr:MULTISPECIES: hypothetical protein [Kocuria]OLT04723.1 hypothetical protein BJF77_04140 [Kocuria sp. CNJ-770]
MVFAGMLLLTAALLLVLLLARATVLETVRFQRLTAMAVLGLIVVAAAMFAAGLLVTGGAVLGLL